VELSQPKLQHTVLMNDEADNLQVKRNGLGDEHRYGTGEPRRVSANSYPNKPTPLLAVTNAHLLQAKCR